MCIRDRLCGAESISLTSGRSTVSVLNSKAFAPSSLVLRATESSGARLGSDLAAVSSAGHVVRKVDSPQGGVVTLHENANPGWSASKDGKPVESVVVDGWQQGWRVPEAGAFTVSFQPDYAYRWGLGVGALAWAVLVVMALWPRRWRCGVDLAATTPRVLPTWAVVIAVGAAAGLLGGLPGVLAVAAGALVNATITRRNDELGLLPPAALLIVAGFAWVIEPWGSSGGWAGSRSWPIYVAFVALGCVLAGSFVERPRVRRRMKGSSINR